MLVGTSSCMCVLRCVYSYVQYTSFVIDCKSTKPGKVTGVWYNKYMTSNELAQLDDEIIAGHLIKLFTFRAEHPGVSTRKACEELGLNYQATTRWLREGKLTTYLADIHDVRSDAAQITALDELQSIVTHQAMVARGEAKGNSTAAAAFVLEIAKMGARSTPIQASGGPQLHIFIPQMGRPTEGVIDSPSVVEIKDP